MIPGMDADNFNPRILYISKECYDSSNLLSSHFHSFYVIMYVYDIVGSGWYRIEKQKYPIERNTIIVCNPLVFHEKILNPGSEIHEYHIAFEGLNIAGQEDNGILVGSSYMLVDAGEIGRQIRHEFREALKEQEHALPGFDAVVKAIGMKIIALTLRLIQYNIAINRPVNTSSSIKPYLPDSRMFNPRPNKQVIVESVRKYLNENYNRKINIGSIAKSLHISHVYLSRIFRGELGESVVSYLAKLRLNMACELLESGKYTVKSAALSVGYEDPSYFSRHFKKYFGVPPAKFKRGDNGGVHFLSPG